MDLTKKETALETIYRKDLNLEQLASDHENKPVIVKDNFDAEFMAVYGTALFTGCLVVARLFNSSEKIQQIYLYLAVILAPASVVLDLIEEYNILVMLSDPSNIMDINAFGASLSTLICIWLVYGGLFLVLIGLLIGGIQTLKSRK